MHFFKKYSNVTNLTIFIVLVILFFAPLFAKNLQYLICYEDDFYYYLKIAINYVEKGFPTFDGEIATNGYQPLWFLIIVSLVFVFGKAKLFFITISILIAAISLGSLKLLRNIFDLTIEDRFVKEIAVVICMFKIITLSITGMEVIATIYLILKLVNYYQKNSKETNYLYLGLLLSLIILSRLDSILFVSIFLTLMLVYKQLDKINFVKLLVGLSPVLVYLIFNKYFFDSYLPISGAAKQLRQNYYPNFAALSNAYFGNYLSVFLHFVPLLFASIVVFSKNIKGKTKLPTELMFSLTMFTLLYYPIMSVISGWRFWNWHDYAFTFTLILSCIIIDKLGKIKYIIQKFHIYIFALSLCYLLIWSSKLIYINIYTNNSYYTNIYNVSCFINSHPGKYGMGDRAGLISYLSNYPIFQLEGLVEDKNYLNNINDMVDLKKVFNAYKLDYYISFNLPYDKSINQYIAYEPIRSYEFGNKYMTTNLNYEIVHKTISKRDTYFVFNLNKPIN